LGATFVVTEFFICSAFKRITTVEAVACFHLLLVF
jgi:hypothetical protein